MSSSERHQAADEAQQQDGGRHPAREVKRKSGGQGWREGSGPQGMAPLAPQDLGPAGGQLDEDNPGQHARQRDRGSDPQPPDAARQFPLSAPPQEGQTVTLPQKTQTPGKGEDDQDREKAMVLRVPGQPGQESAQQ